MDTFWTAVISVHAMGGDVSRTLSTEEFKNRDACQAYIGGLFHPEAPVSRTELWQPASLKYEYPIGPARCAKFERPAR